MKAAATATANPTPKLRRLRSKLTGLRPAKRKRSQIRTMPPTVTALEAPRTRSGFGSATNPWGSIAPLNVLAPSPRRSARMPSSQGAPPSNPASASASCSAKPSATIETSSPAAAREEAGSLLIASTRISAYAPTAIATINSSEGPPIALSPACSAIRRASFARSGCRKSPSAMPKRISRDTSRKALRSSAVAKERSTTNQSSASARQEEERRQRPAPAHGAGSRRRGPIRSSTSRARGGPSVASASTVASSSRRSMWAATSVTGIEPVSTVHGAREVLTTCTS